MKESYVSVMSLRRRVFAEVARMAFTDRPIEELETAGYRLFPGQPENDRQDIFRQRAIAEEMIRLAMGMGLRDYGEYIPVTDGFDKVDVDTSIFETPLVDVIKFACEACPTRAFVVTDNCRRCMAHPCTNVCPVNAVSIGKHGAIIDKEKCVRCGRCKNACPYNAIVEYDRPCASVCGVDAIESDELDRAIINHDKCVGCGRCVTECPWGAIGDKTMIYQLAKALKSKKRIYAIPAPSYIGQFGESTTPAQVRAAMKQLGFEDMVEVGLGADYTTLHEAKEYLERVPEKIPFMGTSCCHSWTLLIDYRFPELKDYVSDSGSPMRYTAEHIKKDDPEAMVCFVGPCTSKKVEAVSGDVKEYVDFVITFEELMGMFVAMDIEPAEMEVTAEEEESSSSARGYAIAGGVAAAVKEVAEKIDPDRDIQIEGANSLKECIKMLQMAKAGRKEGHLLEGMACEGGCIAGMGTIAATNRVRKSVQSYMKESEYKTPLENKLVDDSLKDFSK
ncbi:Iron hydrogenase 1 [Aedoeadaptatus ivorii]|uniref:Iron hydrogenase 1 n=1 Tax=Aedoeadaptatus ivorii TaxID=54006 RepID=A0A448V0V6_9FIRM|nr:4Fe-4S dicluster domain-containing protein [Peptoniphilus ivorii]MDQ0508994.1 [FeFe] hydrogenase (group B1/B3) [Peptoniphilus ivorii]VEJ35044.1 Iron hydrogenase 1 [Peptoniphilus ivorii]